MTTTTTTTDPTKFEYNTDVKQLLNLIVNTFYSTKEVFLRELISNASDSLTKLRHASLTNPQALVDTKELTIEIVPDKTRNTLTIRDTGTGMSEEELISNLGTLAHSTTKNYLVSDADGNPLHNLIGQYGVGFYSAFLVSDKVVVRSKKPGCPQAVWESSLKTNSFTVKEDSDPQLSRGTEIVCFLRDEHKEYLDETRLRDLVRHHSQFTDFPIRLWVRKEKDPESSDSEQSDDDEETKIEIVNPPKPLEATEEWSLLNDQSPLWTRVAESVTPEEYQSFYKTISHDWEDHLAVKQFSIEGKVNLRGVLYTPPRSPFDMFEPSKPQTNIKLYVRRVFILDDCKDFCPSYLSFVQGVIDFTDLPLNISRETIQNQNTIMDIVKKNIVKQCLEMFTILSTNPDDYKKFYKLFSKNLKLGFHEDPFSRKKIVELLRFHSNKSLDTMISLKEYVERADSNQKNIYYLDGESLEALSSSPLIELLNKKGIEVLLLTEPIDPFLVQNLKNYKGKSLVSVSKELVLEEASTQTQEDQFRQKFNPLCSHIKSILGNKIEKIVISNRLVDSPCALSTSEFGWSARMEQIMKTQTMRDISMHSFMASKKILELNPTHFIIQNLQKIFSENPDDGAISNLAWILYDTALLTSGFSLTNPRDFVQRIYQVIAETDEEPESELERVQTTSK